VPPRRAPLVLVGESTPLVEPPCLGRGFGLSLHTGAAVLEIAATNAWEAVVDQQVDTPISEPPLPGLAASARLADGSFHGIDQEGSGTAALYRPPAGGC